MSDMQTKKVKIKADTADEATAAAKKKVRDSGGDVRGALMPSLLSEGEWEVEVLVGDAPKPPAKKPAAKKAPAKKKSILDKLKCD